jgi:hypothetical protein
MNDNRKLPDGIELAKENIFWPEGRWSFRRGGLVWSRLEVEAQVLGPDGLATPTLCPEVSICLVCPSEY